MLLMQSAKAESCAVNASRSNTQVKRPLKERVILVNCTSKVVRLVFTVQW